MFIFRILKYFIILGFIYGFFLSIVAGFIGIYFYNRWTKDLPKIERISDYEPKAVTTIVSDDGTPIARLFDEYRIPATHDEIPLLLKQAFLAAEDSGFYNHAGVDLMGISRAMVKNVLRKLGFKRFSAQGGSTITQQTVKSLLLTRDKTIERKVKEVVLAYRIENSLTKDEIITIYLNEIFFGANAYGVKAAAWMHFRKELQELNLLEMAYLAALPQRPSYFADPRNKKDLEARMAYVLDQMIKNKFVKEQDVKSALSNTLKTYPPDLRTVLDVPYYATFAMSELEDKLRSVDPSITSINPGGYTVWTEVNIPAQEMAERAVQRGLRALDKRRGWRGPLLNLTEPEIEYANLQVLESDKVYKAVITSIAGKNIKVRVGDFQGVVDLASKTNAWAKNYLAKEKDEKTVVNPESLLAVGQIIEVSIPLGKDGLDNKISDIIDEVKFDLDETPEAQAALVLLEPISGAVKAVVGGYDFDISRFNRATQGLRQPGSTFKPIVYTAALDVLGFTPSTIVPDKPISITTDSGEVWEPRNFERRFDGDITLRTALQKSKNVVAAYLIDQIGVDKVVNLARKFGLTTPIGRDPSICLGAAEVKLLELVSVFGIFPAGGELAQRIVITKIADRNGNVIYEQAPKSERVLSKETAFIMSNMLKGVVERGTGRSVSALGRPVAGKTGTAQNQTDACWIGFTPDWVSGIWVGFDTKKELGEHEMAGRAAAPIFLDFMKNFLAGKPAVDFVPPEGVVPVPIDINTGLYSANPNAFIDYFKKGTEPIPGAVDTRISKDYLSSDEF